MREKGSQEMGQAQDGQQVADAHQRVGFARVLYRLADAVCDSNHARTRVQSRPGEDEAADFPGAVSGESPLAIGTAHVTDRCDSG